MTNCSAIELHHECLQDTTDEENGSSDDFEVSVANMNRNCNNPGSEVYDVRSCGPDEGEHEILSDEEYTYSEDSVCSEDSCRNSEMTNVTPRSSLSTRSPLDRQINLDYPIGRLNRSIRNESPHMHHTLENDRRMCSSANDNRYSITNEVPLIKSAHSGSRRRNMSFTNAEMRKIERENQHLLKKIMGHQKPQNKPPMRTQSALPAVSSSAINRRKLQKRIEEENMMLLRRIQEAKSCTIFNKLTPGYRFTSL